MRILEETDCHQGSQTIEFEPHDRVLMLAPHPDDEVLAGGTLLQRAAAAGCEVRVLFATDGESNPWPQRASVRSWKITPAQRTIWGNKRREEARHAISHLGLPVSCAGFLRLPDQGITGSLMRRPGQIPALLAGIFRDWQPTILVLPSFDDVHRDHNALAVCTQMALHAADLVPEAILQFVVHGKPIPLGPGAIVLRLTEKERTTKRQGILCHRTQMLLSQRRFLSYAKPVEVFSLRPALDNRPEDHPVQSASVGSRTAQFLVRLPSGYRALRRLHLMLAGETLDGRSFRCRLIVPRFSGCATLRDTLSSRSRRAAVRVQNGEAIVRVPLPETNLRELYVKVSSDAGFNDLGGWSPLLLPSPAFVSEDGSAASFAELSAVA